MEKSVIEFKHINDQTIVTEQLSARPLKIINPKSSKKACLCMLTNYGGGFVQGDVTYLDIKCRKNTTSIISSQANTRVYESTGVACSQHIDTIMETNAFHVFINDPLVMHQGSSFNQKFKYTLQVGSILLLVDWFAAGRTDNGEQYDFKSYQSETEIFMMDKLVIKDKFHLTPDQMDISSPAALADHMSFMNIYLAGDQDLEKIEITENALNTIQAELDQNRSLYSSAQRVNENTYVARFSSPEVLNLRKVLAKISKVLGDKRLLHFDLLERKY